MVFCTASVRTTTFLPKPATMIEVDVVLVLTLTCIIKSVVTGQAPVTLELRNTPDKKYKQTKCGTRT